ncbi:hypothetical protein [Citrifermentans bemidjiense]|nr:hypothetical protein [Citrifermentans bemidjiense]
MKLAVSATSLLSFVSLLAGCGGGGGESAPPQIATPTNSLVISTSGTAAALYGVQFTLQLPPGVTLATQGGALAAGVIAPSGGAAGATVTTNYDPVLAPRTVTVSLIKAPPAFPAGFPVGPFMTIIPVLPQGMTLAAGDFTLSSFKAWDDLTTYHEAPQITGAIAAP